MTPLERLREFVLGANGALAVTVPIQLLEALLDAGDFADGHDVGFDAGYSSGRADGIVTGRAFAIASMRDFLNKHTGQAG